MHKPSWKSLFAIVSLSFSLLAGCQSGGPGQAETSPSQAAGAAQEGPAVSKDNPCTLLTPEQVIEAVGMKFTLREVVDEVTCSYEFPDAVETTSPETTAPGSAPSEQAEAEEMAKTFAVGASGGVPKFSYTIHWEDGETVVMATRMANQLLGSEMQNAFTKIEGIGDETWLGPLASTLVVRKGDVAVEFDLRLLPEGEPRGRRLAEAVANRL
jgi:hypothetical protein